MENQKEIVKVDEVSVSPVTMGTHKILDTHGRRFALSVNPKLKRRNTVSLSSVFDADSKKKKKKLSKCDKFRNWLFYLVDNLVFHIVVLLLSIYSLFFEDLKNIVFPLSVDEAFVDITEAIFFFFFLEFIVLLIAKKKFVGSFYFYLDVISLISLLPNCPLIWEPLMGLIAGSGASKYLRLLRLINFIKVIRVAKMVESSKLVKSNINRSQIKSPDYSHMKKTKDTINEDQREAVNRMVALTLKVHAKKNQGEDIELDSPPSEPSQNIIELCQSKKSHSRLTPFRKNEITEFNRSSSSEKNEESPKDNIISQVNTAVVHTKNKQALKLDLNNIPANRLQDDLQHNVLSSKKKRGRNYLQKKNTFGPTERSQPKDDLPLSVNQPIIEKQISRPKFAPKLKRNLVSPDSDIKSRRASILLNLNQNKFKNYDENLPVEDNTKRFSAYYSNMKGHVKQIFQQMTQKDDTPPSENSDDNMDKFEEKKMQQRIEKRRHMSMSKIAGQVETVEIKSTEAPLKDSNLKKSFNEEDLFKEVSRKANSKLEKALTTGITHQVIILIMILLISIPMLDISFIFGLVYPVEMLPEKDSYCVGLIFMFMSYSLNDSTYLGPLNKTVNQCFNSPDYVDPITNKISAEVQRIILIDFSQSQTFLDLQVLHPFLFTNSSVMKADDYDHFIEETRIDEGYYNMTFNFDANNSISISYDTHTIGSIHSLLSILKSTFVAFLLIFGSYVFSQDVSDLVISPLDKIFTKLNLNLKNLELIDKDGVEGDENDLNEQDSLDLSQLFRTELNKSTQIKPLVKVKRKKAMSKADQILKKSLEPYFIDKSLHRLLKHIDMSIGKIAFLVIPISDLDKELRLNINSPAIKFEIVSLSMKISNTEEFFYKHMNKAPSILSKMYTIFHALGTVFLGEPYKKENLNAILWKRSRKDWMNKSKSYASNLVKRNNRNSEEKGEQDTSVLEEVYKTHFADFAVISGLRVIHAMFTNLKRTMMRLRQCNVKVNFYVNSGEVLEFFAGNEDAIDECFAGSCLIESNKIMDNIITEEDIQNEISESSLLSEIYPSLYIDENAMPLLSNDIKKSIFPYEVIFDESRKEKKRRTIHRHFFNYSHYFFDEDLNESIYLDNFNFEKFTIDSVMKQRSLFERLLARDEDKSGFVNYLCSDDAYISIISDINPNIQTLILYIYQAFELPDYAKCLNILDDLRKIFALAPVKSDPILRRHLDKFRVLVEGRYEKGYDHSNYTLKLT